MLCRKIIAKRAERAARHETKDLVWELLADAKLWMVFAICVIGVLLNLAYNRSVWLTRHELCLLTVECVQVYAQIKLLDLFHSNSTPLRESSVQYFAFVEQSGSIEYDHPHLHLARFHTKERNYNNRFAAYFTLMLMQFSNKTHTYCSTHQFALIIPIKLTQPSVHIGNQKNAHTPLVVTRQVPTHTHCVTLTITPASICVYTLERNRNQNQPRWKYMRAVALRLVRSRNARSTCARFKCAARGESGLDFTDSHSTHTHALTYRYTASSKMCNVIAFKYAHAFFPTSLALAKDRNTTTRWRRHQSAVWCGT